MAMLDSLPVFEARLAAAGLEEIHIRELVDARIDSLAKLAFMTNCQPGVGDDKELLDKLGTILKYDPANGNAMPAAVSASIRRVWYEAHSVAMAEMRQKVERSEDALPKKLPLPERESRRRDQQHRLGVGIEIEGILEPSNSLIDYVFTMREDETVRYVDPLICAARESEISGVKKETFVKMEATGSLRAVQREHSVSADIGSEFKLRTALQRRSLALDQLDLIDYTTSERYHSFLFSLLNQTVPESHHPLTVQQLMNIDKQVWTQMALECRSGISRKMSGVSPMVDALKKAQVHPMVKCLMQPLPRASNRGYDKPNNRLHEDRQAPIRESPYWSKGSKGKKGGGKGRKGDSGKSNRDFRGMPPGLQGGHRKMGNGKSICFSYNLQGCPKSKPGSACDKGMHVCAGCESAEHTFPNCSKKN